MLAPMGTDTRRGYGALDREARAKGSSALSCLHGAETCLGLLTFSHLLF